VAICVGLTKSIACAMSFGVEAELRGLYLTLVVQSDHHRKVLREYSTCPPGRMRKENKICLPTLLDRLNAEALNVSHIHSLEVWLNRLLALPDHIHVANHKRSLQIVVEDLRR
jgi:hypothetical protein